MILKEYLYEKEAVLAVEKGNEKLLTIFNKGIINLNKKQTMDNINNKWFGSSPLITKNNANDRLFLIIRYALIITGFCSWFVPMEYTTQKKSQNKPNN